jgi:hypothetical protein
MFRKLTETKSEFNSISSNLNGISLNFDRLGRKMMKKSLFIATIFRQFFVEFSLRQGEKAFVKQS